MASSASLSPAVSASPRRSRLVTFAAVLLALLVIAGPVADPIVKRVLNRRLAALGTYTGHVEDVSVSWWRGRVQLRDAVLRERAPASPKPFVAVSRAALNVSYLSLLRGKLSAAVTVDGAEINLAAQKAPEKKPSDETLAKAARWQDELRRSFPMEIRRLEVSHARVRFVDEARQPRVDVGLDQLHLLATGLTNRPAGQGLPTRVDADAVVTGNGQLKVLVKADPTAPTPTFNARLQLRGLSLPAFNAFLLAYANADVSAGTFDFDSEMSAANGRYEGYVKPFFKDLNFKTASDRNKTAAQLLAKKAVSAVASLLKNDEEQKVATKAPFSGNFASNDVDLWTTIANLLRNAFVQGLREGFEGQRPAT